MANKEIVIVEACRTPFDKFGGAMKDLSSIELAKISMNNVVERAGIRKSDIERIYMGVALPSEVGQYSNVPIRQALLQAGFEPSTVSITVDRACCSSMAAFQFLYKDMLLGECEVAMAVGAESLSNVPLLCPAKVRWGSRASDINLWDPMAHVGYDAFAPVSVDTETVAKRYNVTREDMDKWSVQSHKRYFVAKEAPDKYNIRDKPAFS